MKKVLLLNGGKKFAHSDELYVSPGLALATPALQAAAARGVKLSGDIDLFGLLLWWHSGGFPQNVQANDWIAVLSYGQAWWGWRGLLGGGWSGWRWCLLWGFRSWGGVYIRYLGNGHLWFRSYSESLCRSGKVTKALCPACRHLAASVV